MNESPFKTKIIDGKEYIFDLVRKKFIILTPEEWVRQNMLHYMIHVKKYAPSLISVERQIKIGTLKKRYDIVVYQQDKPWLIVECKSETETINPNVVNQILAYQSVLQVHYLSLTNGKEIRTYDIKSQVWFEGFPD